MTIKEERIDLFSLPYSEYMFVHCISSDFVMGAGIAKEFRNMGVRDDLKRQYSSVERSIGPEFVGHCCVTTTDVRGTNMSVANLVTKPYYDDKPTYMTMTDSLMGLRSSIRACSIKKIAMPRIGCGLDRLKWDKVKEIICYIFKDEDVDITVCSL